MNTQHEGYMMNSKTILLAGMLLMTPMLMMAEEVKDITVLIEKAQNATFSERFEIIGQIKKHLSTLNEQDREVAMAQIQVARDATRQERKEQFGGEMSEERIADIKANMTAEQVTDFEKRLESHKKGEGVRRGPPTQDEISEIKANMTPEQEIAFDAKIKAYQENKFRGKVQ
jgi:hypothetical protein